MGSNRMRHADVPRREPEGHWRGVALNRPAMLGLLLASLPFLAGSSCENRYPVSPEQKERLRSLVPLLEAAAAANNAPIALAATNCLPPGVLAGSTNPCPAYSGDTSIEAAIACLADINERESVMPVDNIRSECRESSAPLACASYNGNPACDGSIWYWSDLLPPGPTALETTSRGSIVDLGMVLYHESVHVVQGDRWSSCRAGLEPENYEHQRRFLVWASGQLGQIAPGTSGPCNSLDAAVTAGMHTSVRDFLVANVAGTNPAVPYGATQCSQVRTLANRASTLAAEASRGINDYRWSSRDCAAAAAAVSPLYATSEDYLYELRGSETDGTVYLFQRTPTGLVLHSSYPTTFTRINDLRYLRDSAGVEYAAVFGTRAGVGTILAIEDATYGEFATPPDGILNGEMRFVSDPRLQTISQFVPGGANPSLAWDRLGQRAARITFAGPRGLPSSLATMSIRVPAQYEAEELYHDETRAMAVVTLDGALDDASPMLLFEDVTNTGVYSMTDQGTPTEIGGAPPRFVSVPTAGSTGVWIQAAMGSGVEVFPANSSGAQMGAILGSTTIGPTGYARVTLSRALVLGEFIRVKDTTFGIRGPSPQVVAARPSSAFAIQPDVGPSTGGTTVWLRGAGFTGATGLTFSGVPGTSFTVLDDSTVRAVSPASSAPFATVRLVSGGNSRVIGSFRYATGFGSFTRSGAFSSWTRTGTGWTCGASVFPASDAPAGSDTGGCQYAPASGGSFGTLTSPTITVPGQTGRLVLRVRHRGNFGTDGDGVVYYAKLGSTRYTLRPRDEPTQRIDGRSCTGSGGSRTCLADPPNAGAQGYARALASFGWRTSYFDLPSAFDAGGSVQIEVIASNMSTVSTALEQVAAIDLYPLGPDSPTSRFSNWTSILATDVACSGTVVAPFTCGASPVAGANGIVYRYSNAPVSSSAGQVTWPVNLTPLAGRTIIASIRHYVDMTAGTNVGPGTAKLRVCCGGLCTTVSPTSGYPYVPPGISPAFTDEGPDATGWMEDNFDLSSFGGGTSCTVMLKGQEMVAASQPGWLVDSLSVRWR